MSERPWMHHPEFTNESPRSYITYRRDSQTTRIRVQLLVSLNSSVTFLTFLSKAAVVFEKSSRPVLSIFEPSPFSLDVWLLTAGCFILSFQAQNSVNEWDVVLWRVVVSLGHRPISVTTDPGSEPGHTAAFSLQRFHLVRTVLLPALHRWHWRTDGWSPTQMCLIVWVLQGLTAQETKLKLKPVPCH